MFSLFHLKHSTSTVVCFFALKSLFKNAVGKCLLGEPPNTKVNLLLLIKSSVLLFLSVAWGYQMFVLSVM